MDLDDLVQLELQLLDPDIRGDGARLRELIDDEFVEVGQSGRTWDKASIIEALVAEAPVDPPPVTDAIARFITPDVALINYRTSRPGRPAAFRSSWWRQSDGMWRIVYHQATTI